MAHLRRWQLELQQIPPDQRDRNIFNYPIFRFNAGGRRRHISGRIRSLLNDRQIPRWDYFFRPNFYLLRAADDAAFGSLQADLQNQDRKLDALNELPKLQNQLESAKTKKFLLVTTLMLCAAVGIFGYLIFNVFLYAVILVVALLIGFIAARAIPANVIEELERSTQRLTTDLGSELGSLGDLRAVRSETIGRIEKIKMEIGAIVRFHQDMYAQKPAVAVGEQDMDALLKAAVEHLLEREKRRLNYFDDERSLAFAPIIRWALETDRKHVLDSLKPPVYSIAKRGSHYVRYYIQIIFVHRGQLSLYQGFFDLILGEFMGEFRSHVLLANLFQVQDETTTDFDFHRRLQDAIMMSSDNLSDDLNEPDDESVSSVPDEEAQEELVDNIGVVQTTTVRLIGSGEPVALKFVVSGHREGLIAQLQAQRAAEEQAIEALEAAGQEGIQANAPAYDEQLRLHEDRLRRIKEAEDSEIRRATAYNVEAVVNQILEHTRHVVGARAT